MRGGRSSSPIRSGSSSPAQPLGNAGLRASSISSDGSGMRPQIRTAGEIARDIEKRGNEPLPTVQPLVTAGDVEDGKYDDLTASLTALDAPQASEIPIAPHFERDRRRKEKVKKEKKPWSRRRKWITWLLIGLGAVLVGLVGWLGVNAYLQSSKVLNGGSVLSLLTAGTPLQTDSEGRTNILVFGTSQDDAAHQNAEGGGGLWLTDSIELISINQKEKTVKMVGIPRDLWVSIDSDCAVGDYAKINAVYECASGLINSTAKVSGDYSAKDKKGAAALMSTISDVTGVTPQYYVHANYTVLKQTVDAVGGIDVDIKGDGASGIYDTNFDWDCPKGAYTCKNVYYPKDGTYHIDGTQALFLARARGDAGRYSYKDFGLARGDFDRQANQQKIIMAIEKKVGTASVLANPIAVNNLMTSFGNNVSTDISGGELKTLFTFAKGLPSNALQSVSLVSDGNAVVTTGMVSGQSVVLPTSGEDDYSSIIDYLSKQLSDNPAASEDATISIYNASGRTGAASNEQTTLTQKGFTIGVVGTADTSDAGTGKFTLYDLSDGKMPQTLAQLQTTLGVKASTGTVPSDITSDDDFVIIINQ